MPRVEISGEAEAEIDEALTYYDAIRPELADELYDLILHGLERISEFPEAWPTLGIGTRRFILRKFPYDLIYRMRNGEPYVLAFAHQHREPGYWSDRSSI
jgi:plasmid stabilization system protein ParE